MSIRHLLLSMITALTVLALALAAREVIDMRQRNAGIDWLEHSNRISGLAQTASGALGRERGFTVLLLSSGSVSETLLKELRLIRQTTDQAIMDLSAQAVTTIRLSPEHALVRALQEIRGLHSELISQRIIVDSALTGTPLGPEPDPQRWIGVVTRHIDFLHYLVNTSIPPVGDDSPRTAAHALLKDVLFTLGELLGQERAAFSEILARNHAIEAIRYRDLDHLRSNILLTWQRADSLLERFSEQADIQRAVSHFRTSFIAHHENLRADMIDASAAGRPYPVTAHEWYDNATRSIDGVLTLSDLLGRDIDQRVHELRSAARKQFLLTLAGLALALAAVVIGALTVRRRLLRPLLELEWSANAISSGDLQHPTGLTGRDELGRLARAFEHMRLSLLASARERDAATHEMRKLNTAIEHSVSSVIITDEHGAIEYVNPQFTITSGYSPEEVIGRHVSILKSGYTPPGHYAGLWQTLHTGKAWKGDLLNRRKDGELYWESVSISPICDEHGRIINFISIQHDISERKRIEARLDFMSSYDPLTRLPNRALLNMHFSEARSQARRNTTKLALLTVGVRHFKRINDSLGSDVGDRFLCEIATRLTHATREQDTVSRLSGSEFAILLTYIRDVEETAERAHLLLNELRKPLYIDNHTLQPALHAGIALLPDDGDTLDQLLTSSSMALHQAERNGGEAFMFYTETLNAEAQSRLALESALRQALAAGQLELHYQPKVELATGRIIGAEALARWRHPESMEFVSPERFIPIAEECGLIHELGAWALRGACEQNCAWQSAGLPRIAVAVNISALQLQQHGLPEQIAAILHDTGLEPTYLEVELTESAVMDNPAEAVTALRLLKAIGLAIGIDDFGTGYSSLAYLNRLPVDMLKIDRSFISQLETDPGAAAIASSVIALAHRMGLRVVAEGVESQAQCDFLTRQSCDDIQGFYFSPPLPAEQFAALLRAQSAPTRDDTSGTLRPSS